MVKHCNIKKKLVLVKKKPTYIKKKGGILKLSSEIDYHLNLIIN